MAAQAIRRPRAVARSTGSPSPRDRQSRQASQNIRLRTGFYPRQRAWSTRRSRCSPRPRTLPSQAPSSSSVAPRSPRRSPPRQPSSCPTRTVLSCRPLGRRGTRQRSVDDNRRTLRACSSRLRLCWGVGWRAGVAWMSCAGRGPRPLRRRTSRTEIRSVRDELRRRVLYISVCTPSVQSVAISTIHWELERGVRERESILRFRRRESL